MISVKPPPRVVDSWADGSLTLKTVSPLHFFCSSKVGELRIKGYTAYDFRPTVNSKVLTTMRSIKFSVGIGGGATRSLLRNRGA